MSLLSRLRAWIRPASAPADDADGDPTAGEDVASEAAPRDTAARDDAPPSPAPRRAAPPRPSAPRSAAPVAVPKVVERLAAVGQPGGPSVEEAIVLLREVRGTANEAAAVTRVLAELDARQIPEPVLVACADILAVRGDERAALRVLEGVTSTAGLVLAADLLAAKGQLARALGAIERVLARDIGAPGARERSARWAASLGRNKPTTRRLDEATIVAASAARGPFRLLREVARGGAGVVYEAEDKLLGRRVAFKVYHRRGEDRALLEREARLAAALAGPGVLRVFDADPEDGWIALEWIARGSARDALRSGDLAILADIAAWARPLARALARVHDAGLVHADVKPANVLLRRPDDPILGDFGSARAVFAPGEGGSPGYVSPERIAGRASDPRDDVYGYGRVLDDVLHRLEADGRPAPRGEAAWRALAARCIGPDEARPANGAELTRGLPLE